MEDLLKPFLNLAKEQPWRIALHVIDILLVAYVVYRVLALIRGTRAWRIAWGVILLTALWFLSNVLHLDTLHLLLTQAASLASVAIVILVLPELRQTLEGVGKLGQWTQRLVNNHESSIEATTIEEVVGAAAEMSASKVGALIVLEQTALLSEIVSTGVQIEAKLSAALLGAIFYEGNPLHDGAAIIRGNTIVAAACRLPLSESSRMDASLHMRHRAAMGLVEQQDAIVVVVSEERGSISLAYDGKIRRLGSPSELRDALKQLVHQTPGPHPNGHRKRMFSKTKQPR